MIGEWGQKMLYGGAAKGPSLFSVYGGGGVLRAQGAENRGAGHHMETLFLRKRSLGRFFMQGADYRPGRVPLPLVFPTLFHPRGKRERKSSTNFRTKKLFQTFGGLLKVSA
jgi:hypothetical protein